MEILLTLSTHRTSAFTLRVVQPAINAVFVEGVCAYSCDYIPHASSATHLQLVSLATISRLGEWVHSHTLHTYRTALAGILAVVVGTCSFEFALADAADVVFGALFPAPGRDGGVFEDFDLHCGSCRGFEEEGDG